MKVSDLAIIPPNGTWRVNFTANSPGAGSSTTGDYNFGLSDRGDQFFLRANIDVAGNQSFVYGTTARRHFVAGGGRRFSITRTRAWPMAARLTPRANDHIKAGSVNSMGL